MRELAEKYLARVHLPLTLAFAFFLPIKLTLAYCALIPGLILWLAAGRLTSATTYIPAKILAPMLLLGLAAAISIPFGINPQKSASAVLMFIVYGFTIPFIADATCQRMARPEQILSALVVGQCCAGLHSIIDGALPGLLPRFFVGKVTESGQLAMTILAALGLFFLHAHRAHSESALPLTPRSSVLIGLLFLGAGTALGFAPALHIPHFWLASGLILLILGWGASILLCRKASSSPSGQQMLALALIALPLLTAALLINLKRGPWAGVALGLVIVGWLHYRKYVWALIAAFLSLATMIDPIRTRLLSSSQDFFISGGRSVIWDIGTELMTRFPLGIGYRNASFLRNYSPEIPKELTHFHNNFLNVGVELGWIGAVALLWLIVAIIRQGFAKAKKSEVAEFTTALTAAIIAWQIAGLVEYNLGDTEVYLIAFLIIGVLISTERLGGDRSAYAEASADKGPQGGCRAPVIDLHTDQKR